MIFKNNFDSKTDGVNQEVGHINYTAVLNLYYKNGTPDINKLM